MAEVVRDVMTADIVTCPSNTPIADVARTMRDRDIGNVLVTEGNRLCGIVTDRDLVVRCLADGADATRTTVAHAVSGELVKVFPGMSLQDAAHTMAEHHVRRLPVIDDGRVVGIVSLGDLAMKGDPRSALAGVSAAPPNS